MTQLEPGNLFAGYRVLDKLGAGGMGQVYLVEHPHLLRREALKVISVNSSDNAEFQRRFTNEARTVAMLNHPGIVAIHHYGVEGDAPWFTMAYLDGQDLTDGRLADGEISTVALRAADALDYAHRHQVIHRDVKPANIIVTREADGSLDQVVLLDFGIAKLADSTTLTATHAFIGTLAYAAPELIDGLPAGPMSDQYALACTIYELLTGAPPFAAPTPSAMMAALLSKPAAPISFHRPELAALDPIFERALAKSPDERFPDCRSFAATVAQFLPSITPYRAVSSAGTSPDAPTVKVADGADTPTVRAAGPRSRRRRSIAASAIALIAVAVVAVLVTVLSNQPSTPSTATPAPGSAFQSISTGAFTTCAVRDRKAYCWGRNSSGQLGDGTTTSRNRPAVVPGLADVTAIAVGAESTCAVASGKAYCWGRLGGVKTPTEIPGLTNVTAVATTGYTACAIAASFLYCWGSNSDGQIGDGTTTDRTSPTKVESLTSVVSVTLTSENTCAVANFTGYCWGSNDNGQIGDGTNLGRLTPTEVTGFDFASNLSIGRDISMVTTCGIRQDMKASCWGSNRNGQIGDGTTTDRRTPTVVVASANAVATDGSTSCAITTTRTLQCWGSGLLSTVQNKTTPTDVRGLRDVTQVAMGGAYCAVAGDDLYCWGGNSEGELGDGTGEARTTPTKVTFS